MAAAAGYVPAWNLVDTKQGLVSSKSLSGETYVLVLHRGSGCLHCAEQLTALGKLADRFEAAGAKIVAVSDDNEQDLRDQLIGFGGAFPIQNFVADPDRHLFQQLDAIDEKNDQSLHGTFLVDGVGRIRWSNVGEHPFMEFESLLSEVSLVNSNATTVQEDSRTSRPLVYLDRSPRVVAYQLSRLSNERLLAVTRKTDDKKCAAVYEAILIRNGMPVAQRRSALEGLATLNSSSRAKELVAAMDRIGNEPTNNKTARELARLLLKLPAEELASAESLLTASVDSSNNLLRSAAYAGLHLGGKSGNSQSLIGQNDSKSLDWLRSIALIPDRKVRNGFRDQVIQYLGDEKSATVRRAAINALRSISIESKDTFTRLSQLVNDDRLRDAAIETMLATPESGRDPDACKVVAESLISRAEATPVGKRNEKQFVKAMQLADELLSVLPADQATGYRARMNEVSVRVVRLLTVKEEMRYDRQWFAAEAGRPLQLVLQNKDLMPHNLVICKPGTLEKVAMDGLAVGPKGGKDGKQYVPKTRDVLFSTDMVQANQSTRLTFDVPRKPGEYPFVCTFPQHWSRMYGVMVVVKDLDKWMKNPKEPVDPIGNTRQLVKKWTVDDFKDDFKTDLSVRSVEAGKQVFTQATCAQCHKVGGEGGIGSNVGPALDEVYSRWKGDRAAVIREILDPSANIDEKYAMHTVATDDGMVRSGIIIKQTKDMIELVESAAVTEVTKIPMDEVEDMAKSSTSIMPKALLDNFSKEEILDLIRYLEASQTMEARQTKD